MQNQQFGQRDLEVLNDPYAIISFWAIIWGTGLGAAWSTNALLGAFTQLSLAWNLSISGAVLFGTVFAALIFIDRKPPHPRAIQFREKLYANRHVVIVGLAGIIGYFLGRL